MRFDTILNGNRRMCSSLMDSQPRRLVEVVVCNYDRVSEFASRFLTIERKQKLFQQAGPFKGADTYTDVHMNEKSALKYGYLSRLRESQLVHHLDPGHLAEREGFEPPIRLLTV